VAHECLHPVGVHPVTQQRVAPTKIYETYHQNYKTKSEVNIPLFLSSLKQLQWICQTKIRIQGKNRRPPSPKPEVAYVKLVNKGWWGLISTGTIN
jgi:hypothetical protein